MSNINSLRDKGQKELVELLSCASSLVLPNSGFGGLTGQPDVNPEVVDTVLSEIREHLKVPHNNFSVNTLSRIYAYLSEEISKAALANTKIEDIQSRLGNKGQLHPNAYQIRFRKYINKIEALGIRKSHIVEAVTRTDSVVNLIPKYLQGNEDPRITVSSKIIDAKRVEDRFILFVVCQRHGSIQEVVGAFRAYILDMDLKEARDPISVIRAFAEFCGVPFRYGRFIFKFIHNEIVKLETPMALANAQDFKPIGVEKGIYWPLIAGGMTHVLSTDIELVGEVVLGFMVDMSKYIESLRRHNVHIATNIETIMATPSDRTRL